MRAFWWRLVRLFFYLLYGPMAWSYDVVSWLASLGQWRAWQRAALPYVEGQRVLELAHGPGYLLRDLGRAGYAVTGLDLSPQMGRLAQRRVSRRGLAIPLVRGRGEQLPFARDSFDTVVSTFPTPFILAGETLQSLRRVVRPGGRVVLVPQAYLTGHSLRARFVNWLYLITGQRPGAKPAGAARDLPAPWMERIQTNGFTLEVVLVTLPSSEVLVVVAHAAEQATGTESTET